MLAVVDGGYSEKYSCSEAAVQFYLRNRQHLLRESTLIPYHECSVQNGYTSIDFHDCLSRTYSVNQPRGVPQPASPNLHPLKKLWRGWLRFAEILGTVQMIVILTIIYWLLLSIMAVPFKFLSDPLAQRGRTQERWVLRSPGSNTLEGMKKQF